jgi:hypothetical protein
MTWLAICARPCKGEIALQGANPAFWVAARCHVTYLKAGDGGCFYPACPLKNGERMCQKKAWLITKILSAQTRHSDIDREMTPRVSGGTRLSPCPPYVSDF